MLVESASLYATFSLLFLIFFEIKSGVAQAVNIVLPCLTMSMVRFPSQ